MTMDAATAETSPATWVLSTDTVRRSVRRLIERRTHEFFPAYVHLRRRAFLQGGLSDIRPDWTDLGHWLEVPGAHPKKPYLRPFRTPAGRKDRDYWLNINIRGSYAPSSLRKAPLNVVRRVNADGTFDLRDDHAPQALEHLLYGDPMSVVDLAAFFLRDHGIVSPGRLPTASDLVDVFRMSFGLLDDDEFTTVYARERTRVRFISLAEWTVAGG